MRLMTCHSERSEESAVKGAAVITKSRSLAMLRTASSLKPLLKNRSKLKTRCFEAAGSFRLDELLAL
jgi:hypothetical protein